MAADRTENIRYIIVHKPGPLWVAGTGIFEQPGVTEHAKYYTVLNHAGKVSMGGPFMDATGGMMIPAAGLSREDVDTMAKNDPTVKSGLFLYEVKPWYVVFDLSKK